MFSLNSRVVHRPLALSASALIAFAALTALTACADEPVGPKTPATATPSVQPSGDPIYLTVTNSSGGTEVGSIRWAASQVVRNENWIIQFDPKLAGDTITLGAELFLDYPATIEGPREGITLSGNDQHRVILAIAGATLRNLTITKGNSGWGSAIFNGGELNLWNTTVQDNRGPGPVIDSDGWRVRVMTSTISRNVGTGAIEYRDGSQLSVWYSTIAFNTGPALSYEDGGRSGTRVDLTNSILAHNTPENCTSYYGFLYWGKNISTDWSCGEVYIEVADPQLKPLAYNGGPNMTHAIPHTSPAFNAVPDYCSGEDQRYVQRDAKCDVGAFEFADFATVAVTIDPSANVNQSGGSAVLTGTVQCSRDETFSLAVQLTQQQKTGKTPATVDAANVIPVQCSTTPRPWSASMVLTSGSFQVGSATATAQTMSTQAGVTPASATGDVKLYRARR